MPKEQKARSRNELKRGLQQLLGPLGGGQVPEDIRGLARQLDDAVRARNKASVARTDAIARNPARRTSR